MLQIPDSTIRRYAIRVKAYLSSYAQQRKRLYTQDDLDVLAQVRDLTARGYTLDEVPEQLGRVIDHGEPRSREEPRQSSALALPGLLSRLDELELSQKNWQSQIDQVQRRIDELEAREREWQALPWYKKLFVRKPSQDL